MVLASSSPRRLALLAQIGITPVAVIAPDIDETPAKAEPPRVYAQRMARAKADAVAVRGAFARGGFVPDALGSGACLPNAVVPNAAVPGAFVPGARVPDAVVPGPVLPGAFVLVADTVVAVGRRILPKAANQAEARACIDLLSGRRHRVLTAVLLTAPDGRRAERLSESVVAFARLTEAQKIAWLALGEWEGKAGGYAVNGAAASFIRFLSGSFSGVMGLPLFETAQMLRGFGWPIPSPISWPIP